MSTSRMDSRLNNKWPWDTSQKLERVKLVTWQKQFDILDECTVWKVHFRWVVRRTWLGELLYLCNYGPVDQSETRDQYAVLLSQKILFKQRAGVGQLGSIACGSSTGRSWARRGPQPREVYSLERLQLGSCGLPSYQATRLSGYTRLQCRAGKLGQRNKYNIGTAPRDNSCH